MFCIYIIYIYGHVFSLVMYIFIIVFTFFRFSTRGVFVHQFKSNIWTSCDFLISKNK